MRTWTEVGFSRILKDVRRLGLSKRVRRPGTLIACAVVLSTVSLVSLAAPPDRKRLTIGLSTWFSEGETAWGHDASGIDPRAGNPTSTLTYTDLESIVLELAIDVRVAKRFSISGRLGFGNIDGDFLLDEDFVSAFGATQLSAKVNGAHRFSGSLSQVDDDDLRTLGLEGRIDLLPARILKSSLGIYVGYQNWEESYVATGLTQLECTIPPNQDFSCVPEGFVGFIGEPVISNQVEWDALWIGVAGSRNLGKRFVFDARAAWAPRSEVENRDVHFLREDLAQDPSFLIRGDGDGLELEANFAFRVSQRFLVHAGYRRWELVADNGTLTAFGIDGSRGSVPLVELETVRDGFTLGLDVRLGK